MLLKPGSQLVPNEKVMGEGRGGGLRDRVAAEAAAAVRRLPAGLLRPRLRQVRRAVRGGERGGHRLPADRRLVLQHIAEGDGGPAAVGDGAGGEA